MPRILTQADIARFRDRLCDVATELYAEVGHAGFNMRALAQRVGVSAMTPYRYFRDKDEILDLLRDRGFARLAARLEAGASMAAMPTRRTVAARAYLRFAMEEETSYRLMFDLTRHIRNGLSHEERRILSLLSDTGNDADAGWATWTALHGAIGMYLTGTIDKSQVAKLVEAFAGPPGAQENMNWSRPAEFQDAQHAMSA